MPTKISGGPYLAMSRRVPELGMKNYPCDRIVPTDDPVCYWSIQHICLDTIIKVKPIIPKIYEIHTNDEMYIVQII